MSDDVITPNGDMRLCAHISYVAEMNAVAPVNVMPSSWAYRAPAHDMDKPADGLRHERLIERVHSLGPRALAEMLDEIAADTGQHELVVGLVEKYAELDRGVLCFLGGDKFPVMPLVVAR